MSFKGRTHPRRKIELLKTPSGAVAALCPYDKKFIAAAKLLGGEFGYVTRGAGPEKAWFFPGDKELAAGELLRECFDFGEDQEYLPLAEEKALLLRRIEQIDAILAGKNCLATEMRRVLRPRFRILQTGEEVTIHDSLRDDD